MKENTMSNTSRRTKKAVTTAENRDAGPPAWLTARRRARRYRSVARGYAVLGSEVILVQNMKQLKLLRRGLGLADSNIERCH
jgi:hypothetical protein